MSDSEDTGLEPGEGVLAVTLIERTVRRFDSSDVTITVVVPGPVMRQAQYGALGPLVEWMSSVDLPRRLAQAVLAAVDQRANP